MEAIRKHVWFAQGIQQHNIHELQQQTPLQSNHGSSRNKQASTDKTGTWKTSLIHHGMGQP
jgi:copper homeostasis protein CutC